MTLTEQQVREILAGCGGVTPGPWTREEPAQFFPAQETRIGAPGDTLAVLRWARNTSGTAHHDAAHIARLDPQTVSALCEELLSRRAADAAVRDALENWSRADHLQLHAGEMTAQELRTTKAVVKAISAEILALKSKASP